MYVPPLKVPAESVMLNEEIAPIAVPPPVAFPPFQVPAALWLCGSFDESHKVDSEVTILFVAVFA